MTFRKNAWDATVATLDTELAALDTGISLAQAILTNTPFSRIVLLSNPMAITAILKLGLHPLILFQADR
jgi:hypothetical protein